MPQPIEPTMVDVHVGHTVDQVPPFLYKPVSLQYKLTLCNFQTSHLIRFGFLRLSLLQHSTMGCQTGTNNPWP